MDIIFKRIESIFSKFDKIRNKPKFLIADTIKGKGVNFMEHPEVMKKNKYYSWHAGAPNDRDFFKAQDILYKKIEDLLKKRKIKNLKISDLSLKEVDKNFFEIH